MDTMDNVYMGKYSPNIVIIDGMGWAEKVGPKGYRQSSEIVFYQRMHEIKESVKRDLFTELELEENPRVNAIFNFCWDRAKCQGLGAVVSWFRELILIIN